jgi:LmbE family N-acetylglucosaminyl deacetylase
MRVLAIGAHPDDVEVLCAGTLAHYAARGDEVWIAIATKGDVGSPTHTREEIAAIRRAEAEASCRLIGAQLIWMGFDDEWLFNDRPTRTRFIEAYREARPDVVFTHSPVDYHPDHRAAGQIAIDARIPSAVRLVETEHPALTTIPRLLMMDTVGRTDFVPEIYVDITDTFAAKSRMLSCHVSQDTWLQHLYGMRYVEFIAEQASARGAECGVAQAEAFCEVATYPPAPDPEPLPGQVR